MSVRLSVIIPMHNAEATIAEALRSLQAQEMESWEAIVVDDGSTDGSARIAGAIAASDPRILIHSQSNRGVAAARNAAMDRARGEYLLFLDSDDWMLGGALQALLDQADSSGLGAAYGGSTWVDADGSCLGYSNGIDRGAIGLEDLLECNRFSMHAAIVSRRLIDRVRFDPSLNASEDWDFWIRLAEQGVRWSNTQCDVAAYRMRPASRSRDWRAVASAAETIVRGAFDRAANRGDPPDDDRLNQILLRHALEAATAAAAKDPTPHADQAASILRPHCRPGCLNGSMAAAAAYWAWPSALCCSPAQWQSHLKQWCPALARWWRRCMNEGWTRGMFEGSATAALAKLQVDPDAVARAIADELDPISPVVLLGFGQNGRRLARVLDARGMSVSARDDAADQPRVEQVGAALVPVWPGHMTIHSLAQYVATPSDDQELIARLPVCLNLVRWSEMHEAIGGRIALRLLSLWPSRSGVIGEAA